MNKGSRFARGVPQELERGKESQHVDFCHVEFWHIYAPEFHVTEIHVLRLSTPG